MEKRLKEIRTVLKLQQGVFAEKLGIHQQQYYTYESGKSRPSVDILNKLIENFNVNLNWLLTGRGSMFLDKNSDIITVKLKKGQLLKIEYDD